MEIEKANWVDTVSRTAHAQVTEESVIGPGASVSGELSFPGGVTVFGTISGSLRADGEIVIAQGAEVKANVSAPRVSVSGKLWGEVVASERLEIRAGADVNGELCATVLVIEEGASFEGRCSRLTSENRKNVHI